MEEEKPKWSEKRVPTTSFSLERRIVRFAFQQNLRIMLILSFVYLLTLSGISLMKRPLRKLI